VALILSYIYLQETLDFSTNNKKEATTKEIEMKVIVTPPIQRKQGAVNRVGYQPVKIEGEKKTDNNTIFDMEEGKVVNGDEGEERRDGESNGVMGEEKERNGEVDDETELTGMSINDDITEDMESGGVVGGRVRLWKRMKGVAQRYNPFSLLPPDSIFRNIQCITTCTLYALLGATYIIIDQVHPNFSLSSPLTPTVLCTGVSLIQFFRAKTGRVGIRHI